MAENPCRCVHVAGPHPIAEGACHYGPGDCDRTAHDVETLADDVEFIRSLVGAWDCCASCAGGVLLRRDQQRDAARIVQARAGEGALRERIEALAAKWDARYGFYPNGFCHSLTIHEATGSLRAALDPEATT